MQSWGVGSGGEGQKGGSEGGGVKIATHYAIPATEEGVHALVLKLAGPSVHSMSLSSSSSSSMVAMGDSVTRYRAAGGQGQGAGGRGPRVLRGAGTGAGNEPLTLCHSLTAFADRWVHLTLLEGIIVLCCTCCCRWLWLMLSPRPQLCSCA